MCVGSVLAFAPLFVILTQKDPQADHCVYGREEMKERKLPSNAFPTFNGRAVTMSESERFLNTFNLLNVTLSMNANFKLHQLLDGDEPACHDSLLIAFITFSLRKRRSRVISMSRFSTLWISSRKTTLACNSPIPTMLNTGWTPRKPSRSRSRSDRPTHFI